jgi:VCBS repeat-containing protein
MPSSPKVGPETLVNTTIAGAQNASVVTDLSDGGWVVTWVSDRQDGSEGGIYQQRFSKLGVAVDVEIRVNTTTLDNQSEPAVTKLGDGGWVVTWSSEVAGDTDIFQQRFAANGAPLGDESRVNGAVKADQSQPSVAPLSDDGWVVTWTSDGQDGSHTGVYQQRFGADGSPAGEETRVNVTTEGHQGQPNVVGLTDGGWLVTWSAFNAVEGDYDVVQRRFDSQGEPVGGEVTVNAFTSSDQMSADVTVLTDGGWVVTWTSHVQDDGNSFGIYQQRFDVAGVKVGPETQVHTTVAGNQLDPTVTALGDGGWLVSWASQGTGGYDILQQRFDMAGAQIGGEERVNSTTIYDQLSPDVTTLADGGWLVTWSSAFQDGSNYGVYQQRYNAFPTSPINTAPVANNDAAAVFEGAGTTGNVLSNDTDADSGQTLTVSGLTGGTVGQALKGQYGTLTLQTNGSYQYDTTVTTLPTGQKVTDTFSYTVNDGNGGTASANLVVTVTGSPFPGPDDPIGNAGFGTRGETVGDFDGNNVSDLLFRNATNGNIEIFTTGPNGTTSKIIETIEVEWTFKAVGDIDGDGNDDVVFRNTVTGDVGAWIMRHDGMPSDWRPLGKINAESDIKGIGDFNQDGFNDVLFANLGTGQIDVHFQGKDGQGSTVNIGTADPGWSVAGVGDFDNNGTPDILFYNATTRHIGAWEMNDGQVGGWFDFGTLKADWEITGVGNFNGSGPSDINFYNSVTGEDGVWVMNDGNISDWIQNASHDDFTVMGVGPGGSGTDQVFWNNPINGNYYTFEPR